MHTFDSYLNLFGLVDAIGVLGGSIVPRIVRGETRRYQSTAYSHVDRNGYLGGGKARIIAAAHMARHHTPYAVILTAGGQVVDGTVEAQVLAKELVRYGVSKERIICEDKSANTLEAMAEIVLLIVKYRWRNVLIITNEYHVRRAELCYERLPELAPDVCRAWQWVSCSVNFSFMPAEVVLEHCSPHYQRLIKRAKESQSYHDRVSAEERGREDILSGRYVPVGRRQKEKAGAHHARSP